MLFYQKNKPSTIQGSFQLIDKIINQVTKDLISLYTSIKSKTNNWIKKINTELKKISNNIKKYDDISKIFIAPLNNSLSKIK